ncbi:hypothetical protein FB45DRAFT_1028281 [Roridomyces roridus]|uniref:Homeobox domain-containing protein n=1 Tax=Roridomyces roridus TaxID=1738132 RepID=A0AAD7FPX9_9AGAR|nr:hypothetical protein FB45DRAFT_867317 [Roridomyces roridus]KAJ7631137.1 hypothetical protein FB45DRAFT_1028281 [Roridomyces roridus]
MADPESLRIIIQRAKSMAALLPASPPPIPEHTLTMSYIRPTLPVAQTLEQLIPGLDHRVIERFSPRYLSKTQEIRRLAEDRLHGTYLELVELPRHPGFLSLPRLWDRVIEVFAIKYARKIKALEEEVVAVIHKRRSAEQARKAPVCTQRPTFNHEFTPFLQKYFEYNAYPSAADRAQMAKKSMMEPRQIEVWFQNHRRRAKAEGKYLRRTGPSDPAPYEMCLKSMEEKMQPFLIPEPLRQSLDSDVSDVGSDDEEDDAQFYNDRPEELDLSDVLQPAPSRHAFPMPWSRSRNAPTTIRSTQQFSFPPPEWPRKPSAPVERPVVKMTELIRSFACCHVRDSNRVLSPPFKIATLVVPSPAPHPALVRGKFHPAPVVTKTSLNIIPAPRVRQRPFRSPSPSAQLATLVPPARKKKLAGPPRRTPKKALHHGITAEKSMVRSNTPPSRTPSLEASDFSPSRTPSFEASDFSPSRTPSFGSTGFSSRSTSTSSGPATPVGSPVVHPLEIREYLDLFGDDLPSRRSASPAFFMSEKQGFEFSFTG